MFGAAAVDAGRLPRVGIADDHVGVAPGRDVPGREVDQGRHPVAWAHQLGDVQADPGQPGDAAREVDALGEFDDRGGTSDRGL